MKSSKFFVMVKLPSWKSHTPIIKAGGFATFEEAQGAFTFLTSVDPDSIKSCNPIIAELKVYPFTNKGRN